jgi:outer membrane murein-binding lipoprotein Lpp
MKKRFLYILITALLLLPVVFTGCQSGVPQADYDQVMSQLTDAQSQITAAQDDLTALQNDLATLQTAKDTLQTEKDSVAAQLAEAQIDIETLEAQVAALEAQVSALKAEYELAGYTPAETAEKIVKYYHDTHVYSSYDLFVCSDMAAEVWNMLKAIGIESVIAVGNVDTAISDILQSNHAWVLAEVAPGQYLALETTGGYSVPESENPLYYRGWAFDSPADLKSYNELVQEYNTRVDFRNLFASEANEAASLYNDSTTPAEADKWLTLYDKFIELINDQEAILNTLMAQINSLASVIQ